MKVGDKINYVSIEVKVDGRIETIIKEHKVVALNDDCFVIDNHSFTTIKRKCSKYDTCLNKADAHEMKWRIASLTDYVRGYIYSTQHPKTAFRQTKKEVEKFIREQYGRYGTMIDTLLKIEFPKDN